MVITYLWNSLCCYLPPGFAEMFCHVGPVTGHCTRELWRGILISVLHFGMSGWYVHFHGYTVKSVLWFLFFEHDNEAWMNSVPAAVWWIQSDTMQKYRLVSASFFDGVLLYASVQCSGMSTSIYLNNAPDSSQLWLCGNRNDESSPNCVFDATFSIHSSKVTSRNCLAWKDPIHQLHRDFPLLQHYKIYFVANLFYHLIDRSRELKTHRHCLRWYACTRPIQSSVVRYRAVLNLVALKFNKRKWFEFWNYPVLPIRTCLTELWASSKALNMQLVQVLENFTYTPQIY